MKMGALDGPLEQVWTTPERTRRNQDTETLPVSHSYRLIAWPSPSFQAQVSEQENLWLPW